MTKNDSRMIEFIPLNKFSSAVGSYPKPATKFIPSWYKSAPSRYDGTDEDGVFYSDIKTTVNNSTYKSCSPFLDALMGGYIYVAPFDIEIQRFEQEDGGYHFWAKWRVQDQDNFITTHDQEQHPGFPSTDQEEDAVAKFRNDWVIKTPKGVSTLFTHPLNRLDLPFTTLSGIVDTDSFPHAVHFPFKLKNLEKKRTLIPEGTPLVQIIPFLRQDWDHKVLDFDENDAIRRSHLLNKNIKRRMKHNWWHRKRWQ